MRDSAHSDISHTGLPYSWRHDPVLPALLVVVGVALIAVVNHFETRHRETLPWQDVVVGDAAAPETDARIIGGKSWRLPLHSWLTAAASPGPPRGWSTAAASS